MQTKETIRRNFDLRCEQASAAHFQATQQARVKLEAAIGAARMEYNRVQDAASRAFDSEMHAAITERCEAMRELILGVTPQVPEPV